MTPCLSTFFNSDMLRMLDRPLIKSKSRPCERLLFRLIITPAYSLILYKRTGLAFTLGYSEAAYIDAGCAVVFGEFLKVHGVFCFLLSLCFYALEYLFKLLVIKCLEIAACLYKERDEHTWHDGQLPLAFTCCRFASMFFIKAFSCSSSKNSCNANVRLGSMMLQ